MSDSLIYRAMKRAADDLPVVERSARGLGVRPNVDIPVNPKGQVEPGTGGMSTAVDSPYDLPRHRRPAVFNGVGRDPVFVLPQREECEGLVVRADQGPQSAHRAVEPARTCLLEQYEADLEATRPQWQDVPS